MARKSINPLYVDDALRDVDANFAELYASGGPTGPTGAAGASGASGATGPTGASGGGGTVGTATGAGGAATLNADAGVVTTEALSTVVNATFTYTINNNKILATDIVFVSFSYGSATTGLPLLGLVQVSAGAIVITANVRIANLDGSLKIAFARQAGV